MSSTSDDTPKRMGKSKKVDRLDASRFQAPGINYRGKLIGVEDVPGPRGDKMCHVAMAKLKAAVKTIGEHKLKVVINVSLDGVRIVEEKSENIIYFHPVQRISFISRDPGDSRAFGYVYGREDGLHQFYGVKTEKVAENIVLNLRDLFQIVFEMKKQEKEDLNVASSSIQDVGCTSSTRKSHNSRNNGFEQLDVGSSPTATYSPSRKAASKYDGPLTLASYSFTSQGPVADDRMSATLPSRGIFQRGVLSHYASEMKRSPMVSKQLPLATKQYSSLTAADCRQLYYQQAGFPAVHHLPNTSSDVEQAASISPQMKLHSHYSSVQSAGWFPVALPPPTSAGASTASARRTAAHPANGLAPCSTNPSATWSSEGWAVFDSSADPVSLSTVVEDGYEAEGGGDYFPATDESRSEFQAEYQIYENPTGVLKAEEAGNSLFVNAGGADIRKSLSPETSRTGRSSSSARVSSGLGVTGGISTPHDGGGPSPKSPSAVPTLASPESLSDDEEEISPDISSFPSPNTPPPPLPLDSVVDFTLQPPVPPPRPKPKEAVATRFVSQPDESPIYSNLPLVQLSTQNSFTLPRPRASQANGDRTTLRPRPIQVGGYDLAVPWPRPARNLTGPHQHHDDLILSGSQSVARHPFLRAKTLASYDEDSSQRIAESTPKNSETLLFPGASAAPKMNTASAHDPFAISLGSRLSKPPSFVTRSAVAADDGLIHTSISPIPRPRPRQRSVPSASRDPSSGASKSVSPCSSKQNPSPLAPNPVDGPKRSDPSLVRPSQNRSERQATGHRKAESLSCDAVARGSERSHKWSLGSSRSDTAPDPFNHVDPFATESFSSDPFSVQPDPLSLESPSSDPFSREFPKRASPFQTRAVTVEMGDVFEESAAEADAEDRADDGENAEKKGASEPDASRLIYKETKTEGSSGSEGMSENVLGVSALVSGLSMDETSRATWRVAEEDQWAGSSKSCISPGTRACAEGDGKSPANVETLHVVASQMTPSFNERRSVLLKNTDYTSNVSSLEVSSMGQNIAMGNMAARCGPDRDDPPAPGSDSVAGFEDSFDPVPFRMPQSHPAE